MLKLKTRMGLKNYTRATPPRCKICRHIEDDDPKRLLVRFIDRYEQDVTGVHCPTLRCGNGWLSENAYKHIVIEDEASISKEMLKLLRCKEKDLIRGIPEKDPKNLSPFEILTAICGPLIIIDKK